MYRTVISTENGIVSLNGTKDEVETFILEQENVRSVRTLNKETGNLEADLTFSN